LNTFQSADDPVGHRLGTRGMDADRHVIVRVLDDLNSSIDTRGFGYSFHEGIVSLIFNSAQSHARTLAEGGQVVPVLGHLLSTENRQYQ